VGGGSGRITIAHDTSGWRGSATATCPAGGLIIQCGIGFSAGGTVPGAERAAASAFSGRFPDSPPPEFQPLPCPFNCLGSPSCTTSTGASSGYVALIVACS
jgi:hypothetical protein